MMGGWSERRGRADAVEGEVRDVSLMSTTLPPSGGVNMVICGAERS